MRLIRLGGEPSAVGADVRAALSAWGRGCGVLGGVAVFGCTPPGCPRPLDAVLVLPHGVIVVVGVDLTEPALTLEAPLPTPWSVDGWPLVRDRGAVNPGLDALESASGLARGLQSRGVEPLPVTAVVAVGPYVEQVVQPTNDLHRGVRVLRPSTTSMLAAARELAVHERPCPAEAARHLLRALDEQVGRLGIADLAAEGFPDAVSPDLASATTMLLPKAVDEAPPNVAATPPAPTSGRGRRIALIVLAAALLVSGLIALLTLTSGAERRNTATGVDGVGFHPESSRREVDCARHSFGDVQAWLSEHPCTSVTRRVFTTEISERPAAVAVATVELPATARAEELRELLATAGTGGITPASANRSFDRSARLVERTDSRVRIVRAVWSHGTSDPGDARLRALCERGMRLPPTP